MPMIFGFNVYRRQDPLLNPTEIPVQRPRSVLNGWPRQSVAALAFGAASGAFGQFVLSKTVRCGTSTVLEMTQNTALGALSLVLIPRSMTHVLRIFDIEILPPGTSYVLESKPLGLLIILGILGASSALSGATMLDFLLSRESGDIGCVSAAGAIGTVIMGLGTLEIIYTLQRVNFVNDDAQVNDHIIPVLHADEESRLQDLAALALNARPILHSFPQHLEQGIVNDDLAELDVIPPKAQGVSASLR